MAPDRELIKFVMDYYTMRAEKYGVLNGLAQSRRVFFITGYVPESAAAKLEKLLQEKYEVVVEYTEPGDEEDVPICSTTISSRNLWRALLRVTAFLPRERLTRP